MAPPPHCVMVGATMPRLNQKQLNLVGFLVLLLGCGLGGCLYWTGAKASLEDRASDPNSEVDTPYNSKKAQRDVELYGGKMALFAYDLKNAWENWKHPKPIGLTLCAASSITALLFFFAAHQRRGDLGD